MTCLLYTSFRLSINTPPQYLPAAINTLSNTVVSWFTKSAVVDSTTVVSPFFNVYVTFFVEKSTVALSVTQPVASLFKEGYIYLEKG